MTITEALLGAFSNVCPRCHTGNVFKSLFKMNESCPSCDFKFEREPGYFLGAMSFSYIFGFIFVLPSFLFLLFRDIAFFWVIAIPGAQVVVIAPFLLKYSRLIWIHLDYRMSPAP